MLAVVATASLIVLYARYLHLLRRRCCLLRPSPSPSSDLESPPHPLFPSTTSDDFLYGLDDSAIKSLPLSLFSSKSHNNPRDCAVCLLEFDHGDALRTLPWCAHAFHADCIDVWLRSHATCPLCRAAVLLVDASASPFVPMRAARIRPSLDDLLLDPPTTLLPDDEIDIAPPPTISGPPRDFVLLKRSYSFGFERSSLAADRTILEPSSTASPWRFRSTGGHGHSHSHGRGFWSKRWPSPFAGGSASASRASRVFSFRSYKTPGVLAVKSPFHRRRSDFFLLSSDPSIGRPRPSSRRSRSIASPSAAFFRPPAAFSSSRMRCGDPEALLSPERLNRR